MLKCININIDNNKSSNEIALLNGIFSSCAIKTIGKILQGLSDEEIIKSIWKRSLIHDVSSQVNAIVQMDNALTQKGIIKVLEKTDTVKSRPTISRNLKKTKNY